MTGMLKSKLDRKNELQREGNDISVMLNPGVGGRVLNSIFQFGIRTYLIDWLR